MRVLSPLSFQQAATLVDLAVTLVDHTESIDQCGTIPAVLNRALDIDAAALAILRLPSNNAEPVFVMCSGCGCFAEGRTEYATRHAVHKVFLELQPFLKSNSPSPCQSFHAWHLDHSFSEMGDRGFSIPPRVMVFASMIDEIHCMLLIAQRRIENAGLTMDLANSLCFVAHELSKLLRCPVACYDSPSMLGDPFDQLTAPELRILFALNSELTEKQLSAKLGFTQHTLHSHIKSIYRKTRVQGRLSLLLRLHSALRRMRMSIRKLENRAESF